MEKHLIYDFKDDYAREPVIRKMNDNSLICLFLTGGPYEPHNDNIIKISYSYDDGKTWSEPKLLFSLLNRGCWSPELFVYEDYAMMIVQTYNAESYYRELQLYRSFSYDNGKTWSEPISFTNGINGLSVRQGIILSNHNLLFPVYYGETTSEFDYIKYKIDHKNFIFRCGVIISNDKGKNFKQYGYINNKECLWEPNCVELEEGHILMFMRNNETPFLGRSDSYDYGKTWTDFCQTNIPNSGTKVTLLKIKGLIVLINNFNPQFGIKNRKNLELWVSNDNCNSWYKKIKIEDENENYFYPHAFYDEKNEKIYVAYENSKIHKLLKLSYDELID